MLRKNPSIDGAFFKAEFETLVGETGAAVEKARAYAAQNRKPPPENPN